MPIYIPSVFVVLMTAIEASSCPLTGLDLDAVVDTAQTFAPNDVNHAGKQRLHATFVQWEEVAACRPSLLQSVIRMHKLCPAEMHRGEMYL